jgi:DNA-binding beta-propeller fold protein YncE
MTNDGAVNESRFQFLEIGGRVPRRTAEEEQSTASVTGMAVRLVEIIGSFGTRLGEFNRPAGIALDGEGSLYVADSLNHRVQKITPSGDVYGLGGPDLLVNPQGVAVDGSRFIYILEQGADRLRKFSHTGFLVFTLGGPEVRVRRFACPTAICLDQYHQIYIAEAERDRITCYSAAGHWQTNYEGRTYEPGFRRPQGVAVDLQGNVYVSDTLNHRIVRLRPNGEMDAVIGRPGPEMGELAEPSGLATAPEGGVWVADSGNDRVQRFSGEGEATCCFPEPDRRDVDLSCPTAVALDGEGSVYVSDSLNHRIIKLAPVGECR